LNYGNRDELSSTMRQRYNTATGTAAGLGAYRYLTGGQ